jgi:hypothetical protein
MRPAQVNLERIVECHSQAFFAGRPFLRDDNAGVSTRTVDLMGED